MARKTSGVYAKCLVFSCLLGVPTVGLAQGDGSAIVCGSPYTIGKGDSLGSVAKQAYGDPARFDILFEANREVIGGDPGVVPVGAAIMVPCLDASGQPMTAEAAAEAKAAMSAALTLEGPLQPAELDTIFGPVALFPDELLSEVMLAATFPLDVVKADRFLKASPDLSDKDRAAAVEKQAWDPSVRQLAAGFPDLIARMAEHIDWTEQAGEAVLAQTEDVLDSIQRLRAKAQENGYLSDNDAQIVQVEDNHISIAPADPEVIYVPVYDSQVIYTTPVAASPTYDTVYYGYDDDDWSDALATGAIIFGTAIILDEIFDDDDYWGGGWNGNDSIDWDSGDINIDRGDINIDGDVNIGSGNIGIGNGNRPARPTTLPARVGGPEGDALAGRRDGTFAPDVASREAARDKISARKAVSPGVAELPAARPSAKAALPKRETTKAVGERPAAATKSSAAKRQTNLTKPKAVQRPTASAKPKKTTAFERTGGSRASAGASRGRSSSGGRRR